MVIEEYLICEVLNLVFRIYVIVLLLGVIKSKNKY